VKWAFLLLVVACTKPADIVQADPFLEQRYRTEHAKKRTVRIETRCADKRLSVNGSGVIISKSEVLTAAHVVPVGCKTTAILDWYEGPERSPLKLERNAGSDIARLTFTEWAWPFGDVELAISPEEGDPLFAVGYPRDLFTKSMLLTVTRGNFAANYPGWRFRHTAPIQGGNSGGGIWLDNGEFVGVVTARFTKYGIPIDGNYLGTAWPAIDPLL